MHTTSAPNWKVAACGNCGCFLKTHTPTCRACGTHINWQPPTTQFPQPTIPYTGTRERLQLEWHTLAAIRERLDGTNTTAAAISPNDLGVIISLTLDAAAGRTLPHLTGITRQGFGEA